MTHIFFAAKIKNKEKIFNIGIVDESDMRLSPVCAMILRRKLQESKKTSINEINVEHCGMKREEDRISNRAKSYLQQRDYIMINQLGIERIDKRWIQNKHLIIAMDEYIKRDIKYNYPNSEINLEDIVFTITELAEINEEIRDPGEDNMFDIAPVYQLIEKCLEIIFIQIKKIN